MILGSDQKSANLKFRKCRRAAGLESGPEWRRLGRHGGWDGGSEIAPEAVNLAAWGGDSGRGPALGEGDPGRRGWSGRISESGHSEIFGERQFTTQKRHSCPCPVSGFSVVSRYYLQLAVLTKVSISSRKFTQAGSSAPRM